VSGEIRVAIVGCGGITSAHLNGMRTLQRNGLDEVRVTVLCSRDPENAARYNDRNDAPPPLPEIVPGKADPLNIRDVYVTDLEPHVPARISMDWRDAVAAPDVDAVLVLASVDVHHAIALGGLTAGKHVMIEKPFAITVRAARRVCELAEERELSLGVAESLRFRPETRATRWALDAGHVGDLEMVVQMSIGSVWSPDKIVGKTAWRHQKYSTGSGILMDIGAHVFDKVRYLCGEPDEVTGMVRTIEPLRTTRDAAGTIVEKVSCSVEDTAFATMSFLNGAVGSFGMSWAGHGQPTEVSAGMVLYGDMGCVKDGRVYSDHAGVLSLMDEFELKVGFDQRERWFPCGIIDPFALELHEFFRAIREARQPETSGEEGLRDIALGYAIIESSVRGETVSFADIEACRIETYQRAINDHLNVRS